MIERKQIKLRKVGLSAVVNTAFGKLDLRPQVIWQTPAWEALSPLPKILVCALCILTHASTGRYQGNNMDLEIITVWVFRQITELFQISVFSLHKGEIMPTIQIVPIKCLVQNTSWWFVLFPLRLLSTISRDCYEVFLSPTHIVLSTMYHSRYFPAGSAIIRFHGIHWNSRVPKEVCKDSTFWIIVISNTLSNIQEIMKSISISLSVW